ncbi:MAG TPA: 50S ribosomal protein L15, partial [Verrucomicrobia bacterium]|nr:50S ribosomal protein L15 [Verrucomicrobiota bacterium]
MDLHSLTNTPGARHRRKRLGRGMASGKGKTSGKGHKGQMARKGHKHKLAFEGGQMPLIRRLPKRGFKNPARVEYIGVNLTGLDRFEDGATVDPVALRKAGLANGASDGIKILGRGEITKKLTVKANAF